MKKALLGALGAGCLLAGIVSSSVPGTAADHLEAPLVQEDGRTDINDLYAFQSPENPDNTVLIMTVNPVAGVLSPQTLDARSNYRFRIDHDGDAKPDQTIRLSVGAPGLDGSQELLISGLGEDTIEARTGGEFDLGDGGRGYIGTFDDPFFFDFQAFQDQVKAAGGPRTFCDATPGDFFAGLNVTGIVLEVPSDWVQGDSTSIGVWAETWGRGGRIDRIGRPGIATVLINDGDENTYNRTRPHQDNQKFGEQVAAALVALSGLDGSGYTEEEAQGVTDVLLPDILTFDTSSSDGYLNGRGLSDDVIDASLAIVTGSLGENGSPVLESDCVDTNDVPFPNTFPYLAPAH